MAAGVAGVAADTAAAGPAAVGSVAAAVAVAASAAVLPVAAPVSLLLAVAAAAAVVAAVDPAAAGLVVARHRSPAAEAGDCSRRGSLLPAFLRRSLQVAQAERSLRPDSAHVAQLLVHRRSVAAPGRTWL